MPQGGRPFGAMGSKQRRQWERDQAFAQEHIHIEELDSDDSDGIDTGFVQKRRFFSNALQYTGTESSGRSRERKKYVLQENSDESGSDERNMSSVQITMREKEERLVQSAMARIRKAQEKGKKDVKLHEDELKALERRRKRLKEEAKKKKNGSSSTSDKDRRRSDRMITVPVDSLGPRRRSGSGAAKRKDDSPSPRPKAITGPGLRLEGPNGTTYVPFGGYTSSAVSSRTRSASNLQYSSRPRTPPSSSPYQAFNPSRHVSDGSRFPPSPTRRSLPDDEDWIPSPSRRTRQQSIDPFDYETTSDTSQHMPGQFSPIRRGVSGPAEIQYSNFVRQPPGFTAPPHSRGPYINPHQSVQGSVSDPALSRRRISNKVADEVPDSEESESSSSDRSDASSGVLIDPPPRERERTPSSVIPARKPVGGAAKKKGKR